MKKTWIAIALLLGASRTYAGTFTAASCSRADVNAVINGPTHTAVAGDIILIPATGSPCTWTSGVTFSVGITVQGAGTPNSLPSQFGAGTLNTVIVDNIPGSAVFSVTALPFGQTARISTLDIEPVSTSTSLSIPIQVAGTCTSSGCPNVRIDNIGFGITTQWTYTNISWLMATDNVFGVVDHNTMANGTNLGDFIDPNHSAYLGVGAFGDNSWAQPDTYGTASALYIENNLLFNNLGAFVDTEVGPSGGAIGGARYVARFNHITSNQGFGYFGNHGTETDGRPRSGRQEEVYNNTITSVGSNATGVLAGIRGGVEIVFGNTATRTGTAFLQGFAGFATYRTVFTNAQFGACGGSSAFDTNDGTVYYTGITSTSGTTLTDVLKTWTTNQFIPNGAPFSVHDITGGWWAQIASNTATTLTIADSIPEQTNSFNVSDSYEILRATVCIDQPNRGAGNLISGSTPTPSAAINQALDPAYEWDDTAAVLGGGGSASASFGAQIIANRDWYTDNANGSPTAQTSATAPFNGTGGSGIGVGFGTLARRPTTCTTGVGYFATDQGSWNSAGSSGLFYTCTSTNTWTQNYTPYTYPHPLTAGGGGTTPPVQMAGKITMLGKPRIQ